MKSACPAMIPIRWFGCATGSYAEIEIAMALHQSSAAHQRGVSPMPEHTLPERDSHGQLPAYAWPGGYPVYYLDRDSSELCASCASRETDIPAFAPIAAAIHWEGTPIICADCGAAIASVYGDPDEEHT